MAEERMSGADRGLVALATLPMLLVFVAPALVDAPLRLPVTYVGVGLGVLLVPMGVLGLRNTVGRRRTWLKLSVATAALPFVLLAASIGMRWAAYFAGKLLG